MAREGHLLTSAPAVPLESAASVIYGLGLQISQRVCDAEKWQERKHEEREKKKKNTTFCLFQCTSPELYDFIIRPFGYFVQGGWGGGCSEAGSVVMCVFFQT